MVHEQPNPPPITPLLNLVKDREPLKIVDAQAILRSAKMYAEPSLLKEAIMSLMQGKGEVADFPENSLGVKSRYPMDRQRELMALILEPRFFARQVSPYLSPTLQEVQQYFFDVEALWIKLAEFEQTATSLEQVQIFIQQYLTQRSIDLNAKINVKADGSFSTIGGIIKGIGAVRVQIIGGVPPDQVNYAFITRSGNFKSIVQAIAQREPQQPYRPVPAQTYVEAKPATPHIDQEKAIYAELAAISPDMLNTFQTITQYSIDHLELSAIFKHKMISPSLQDRIKNWLSSINRLTYFSSATSFDEFKVQLNKAPPIFDSRGKQIDPITIINMIVNLRTEALNSYQAQGQPFVLVNASLVRVDQLSIQDIRSLGITSRLGIAGTILRLLRAEAQTYVRQKPEQIVSCTSFGELFAILDKLTNLTTKDGHPMDIPQLKSDITKVRNNLSQYGYVIVDNIQIFTRSLTVEHLKRFAITNNHQIASTVLRLLQAESQRP